MQEEKVKRAKLNILSRGRSDVTLMFVVLFLMAFGMIMIYSSSYYFAYEKFGNHGHFFVRQMRWVFAGTAFMYLVSRISFRLIMKFSGLLYVVSLGLLIAVLFMPPINNSYRWIVIGPVNFQPSEIAKIAVIMMLAYLMDGFQKHIENLKVLAVVLLVAVVPVGLIAVANLSTAIVVSAITAGMVFVVYRNLPKLLVVVSPLIAVVVMLFMRMEGYRSDRIDIWLNGPFSDPLGKGFQTIQSLYAIGSGGFFGVGLGKSIQKIDFIPEAHNDIIFSIICEELGLFGAFSVLLLFALLLWRLMDIIRGCRDVMPMLIVVGVMVHISVQVLINIGVVTNTIPATGIPLPFVSYGGSSLMFLLTEMGLVLNIARENNRRMERLEHDE